MIAGMPVECWDARFFTPDQARAIGTLIDQVWPKPTMTAEGRAAQQLGLGQQYLGSNESPRSLVVVEQGRVVAHAAMLPRWIGTEHGEVLVGGLSRVCTEPAARGRGLGELLVRSAFDLVDAGTFEFALFQLSERVRGFYERLGAVPVENRIVNSLAAEANAEAFWDELVMRYPAGSDWPSGEIDLRGPGW